MYGKNFYDVRVRGNYPLLRFYHLRRGKTDLYFFFNESVTETVDTDVVFREKGSCTFLDGAADRVYTVESRDGSLHLTLTPYEWVVLVWNGLDCPEFSQPTVYGERKPLELIYDITLESYPEPGVERHARTTDRLYNITSYNENPRFSGKIRYKAELTVDSAGKYELNLGTVGQIAEVTLNGVSCGLRMCQPFRFELGEAIRVGKNELIITVSNTLVYEQRDSLSPALLIPASGLLGPVTIAKGE